MLDSVFINLNIMIKLLQFDCTENFTAIVDIFGAENGLLGNTVLSESFV